MGAVEEWLGPIASHGLLLALFAGGVALVVTGIRLWRLARAETRDPERALLIARGFRRAIIGLCAAVFAVAWWADVGWLMGLALIVVGEETLESSVHVAALRDGVARSRCPACASPPIAVR
jgi:hypothetical protein